MYRVYTDKIEVVECKTVKKYNHEPAATTCQRGVLACFTFYDFSLIGINTIAVAVNIFLYS
jgi:hypothetical protein